MALERSMPDERRPCMIGVLGVLLFAAILGPLAEPVPALARAAARATLASSSFWGGSGDDAAGVVALAPDGSVYLAGTTTSRDLFVKEPLMGKRGRRADIWITKLSPNGRRVRYSTYFGGRGLDGLGDAVVDAAGNLVLVGSTNSRDFPMEGPPSEEVRGSKDGFVVKLSPSGRVLFSTLHGGTSGDHMTAVDVDAAGAIYVHGYTFSEDYPTTPGTLKPSTEEESQDAIVLKLSPNGEVLYSTRLGGEAGSELGYDLDVDADGSAWVSGWTSADDFPTVNAAQPEFGGAYDAYVAKLDPTGSRLELSTSLGGSSDEGGGFLEERTGGGVAVALTTYSRDLPATGFQARAGGGNADVYLALLSSEGSTVDAASYLGGRGLDDVHDLDADADGALYVVGSTGSTDFPVENAFQPRFRGGSEHEQYLAEGFATRTSGDLSSVLYSTFLGGSRDDGVLSVAVDEDGSARAAGVTYSPDFPTRGARDRRWGGRSDAWFAKLEL